MTLITEAETNIKTLFWENDLAVRFVKAVLILLLLLLGVSDVIKSQATRTEVSQRIAFKTIKNHLKFLCISITIY